MTSNIKILNNKKSFIFIFFILAIAFTIYLLFSVHSNEKSKIESIENGIIEKTKNHFYSLKEMQLWHTDNLGIYIRNSKLKPNQHLSNKQYILNNSILTRISHHKMTKQFARYSKNFNAFYYKITSLKPLNKSNLPDQFEKKGLKYFEKNDKPYFNDNIKEALEKGTFDLIGVLKVEKSCLACHSKQGYKIGDIRGGIRITVDTTKEFSQISSIKKEFALNKTLIIIVSLIVITLIILVINYIFNQKEDLKALNDSLEEKVKQRTKELNELNESLEIRIEEAVAKNKEQEELMIAQSRHAAMGEMISMIAHQWRQPIAVISMGANNIQIDTELDNIDAKEFGEIAQDIIDQTNYLTQTIDDFSDFFKPGKEKTTINPSDIIDESVKMIEKSLEYNDIVIKKEYKKTSQINTYSRELLQVLINIIKNSKEAFEKVDNDAKTIIIQLQEKDNAIFISIIDNAGGIPENIIESIFDPYFSTKKEKNGTGLGLYMSKTIINKHLGGNLSVQNIKNGVKFTIELPK